MNEVRLEGEDENRVIARAVNTLKNRTLGGVHTLNIGSIHEEFLALEEGDVGKIFPKIEPGDGPEERKKKAEKGPKNLDIMSVSRAIEEAVIHVIQQTRSHIIHPYINAGAMEKIGGEVIKILRNKRKKNVKLPHRLAEAIENQLAITQDKINTLESLVREKMAILDESEDASVRKQLSDEIHTALLHIEELNQKMEEIGSMYDFSSLNEKRVDTVIEEALENPEEEGGGIGVMEPDENDPDMLLSFEHSIHLSECEEALLDYVPRELQKSEEIFQRVYRWHTYGEEWQRPGFKIENHPKIYGDMLSIVFRRKRLIAFYARRKVESNIQKNPEIEEQLSELEEEIATVQDKISNIKFPINEGEEDESGEEGSISGAEQTRRMFEDNLDFLYQRLESTLAVYIQMPHIKQQTARDVEKIKEETLRTHRDLKYHCKTHGLESQHIHDPESESNQKQPDAKPNQESTPSIEEYTEGPDFFEYFPETLSIKLSETEERIAQLGDIRIEEGLLPPVDWSSDITFVYEEDGGRESSIVEKMEAIEETIQIVQRRKMLAYFAAQEKIQKPDSQELPTLLQTLRVEIMTLQESLDMITRRISWANGEEEDKGSELFDEIEVLGQKRFDLLRAFMDAKIQTERIITGSKVLSYCLALETRRKMLRKIGNNTKPDKKMDAPRMGKHEINALKLIPPDIRVGEGEFFESSIHYFSEEGQDAEAAKHDAENIKMSFVTERRMLLYFFTMNRIAEIDTLLPLCGTDKESGQLQQERLELESYADIFKKEIAEGLSQLTQMKESMAQAKTPKTLQYQKAYNEAMKVLCELDGVLAHLEKHEHAELIRSYWVRIQEHVLYFASEIEKADEKRVAGLQKEFDEEMMFIIQDIDTLLIQTLDALGHTGKDADIIKTKIYTIRDRLSATIA